MHQVNVKRGNDRKKSKFVDSADLNVLEKLGTDSKIKPGKKSFYKRRRSSVNSNNSDVINSFHHRNGRPESRNFEDSTQDMVS